MAQTLYACWNVNGLFWIFWCSPHREEGTLLLWCPTHNIIYQLQIQHPEISKKREREESGWGCIVPRETVGSLMQLESGMERLSWGEVERGPLSYLNKVPSQGNQRCPTCHLGWDIDFDLKIQIMQRKSMEGNGPTFNRSSLSVKTINKLFSFFMI